MGFGKEAVDLTILSYANKIRSEMINNKKLQLIGKSNSESGIIGILAQSPTIHKETIDKFFDNDITVNQIHEWVYPLFFDTETKVIRLAENMLQSIGPADKE
ncbi:MAG TPA: hypothetical protein DGP89_03460 [Saprospirales bacterium]|nr:hypothetical protein [Saprospiraceae bacterium]HCV50379.1 hypothetical protein [Saprospirales bacterium]